ncbi:hypothetical protein [Halomicrobium katesii]|uniref:hypothetical protein n=1 Tax=Halomicrobium katesii TaxID=437163 RepID=UPI00036FE24B|nr:hypothetical protein [Halomicrobium katesii]
MASNDSPAVEPPRTDAVPESYAVAVADEQIHVWQYQPTVANPDGDWQFVESLDRDGDPQLSLEYAEFAFDGEDGHWVYSRSYDCELDCN